MPAFGDPNAPANSHVGQAYIEQTPNDIAVPNVVTAVLASYRGFDTLGEATVLFCAVLGAITILRRKARKNEGSGADRGDKQ